MRMRLIASRTRRYGTRHLEAGDVFEVSRTEGRAIVAVGLATEYKDRERVEISPPEAEPETDDIDALREQALSAGLKVDSRWRADTLRRKIAEADG